MEAVKEKEWKAKFIELPLLLRIVIVWVYLISIAPFLNFLFVLLLQLSLDPFSLAFGYLIWVLAGGLLDRNNFARIVALMCFVLSVSVVVYIVWSGGTFSLDGLTLSVSSLGSILWVVTGSGSILVLLIPQVRRLFSNSAQVGDQ